ncbi:MAG: hypothetical protein LBG19_07325 [Prevotellaceae bacterium]|jgi:hypothetical protein|nr:hypothetical protein [Prevotellaceae bacterium]
MEKRIAFKQANSSRLKLIAITYFVLLLMFLLYATFGTHTIVHVVNSLYYTVVGLLGGVILIAPLLLILPFTSYRITVILDDEKIRAQPKKGKEVIIRYSSIDKMYLNRKRLLRIRAT